MVGIHGGESLHVGTDVGVGGRLGFLGDVALVLGVDGHRFLDVGAALRLARQERAVGSGYGRESGGCDKGQPNGNCNTARGGGPSQDSAANARLLRRLLSRPLIRRELRRPLGQLVADMVLNRGRDLVSVTREDVIRTREHPVVH